MSPTQLGRYELIRVLGKGAMGLVYEARDPNLERRVAIKTIKVDNLSALEAADYEVRFRTEARSAARLQHPNIVSVYDSGRDQDVAYLVMEFVYGEDLKHHLDRGQRHTLEQTLRIMADLLSALDYAHRQNIVHRDIKPANLLMQASGAIKLTDFGVARIQDAPDGTRTQGTMVGTLKYMSPEQVKGLKVDNRADIFSAGIVLHQLLTGKRAFDGESDFDVMQQIIRNHPAAPSFFNPSLPPALDAVLARALTKSRDERYASAQEFADALQQAALGASDLGVRPPGEPAASSSGSTWSATVRVGESLLNTVPGRRADTMTMPLAAGTLPGVSAVAQELELVYWKDVKDSSDIEDINLFLEKFPAGVYADLARRRQKKLSRAGNDETDTGLWTSSPESPPGSASGWKPPAAPYQPPVKAMAAEAVPAFAAVPPPVAASPGVGPVALSSEPQPSPGPATASVAAQAKTPAPDAQVSGSPDRDALTKPAAGKASARSRRKACVMAGATALLVVGAGWAFWPVSDASPVEAAPLATGVPGTSAAAVAAAPFPLMPLPAPALAITAAAVPTPAAASQAAPGAGATAPASRASAPSGPAPKVTARVPSARAAASAASAAAAVTRSDRPAGSETADATDGAAKPSATAPVPTPPKSAGPRQFCEDRLLLAFQTCMTEQCAKPAFSQHPVCVERQMFEQRRRDADQFRR
ncbi:MAG: serine/threonine protein kinase [Polaromonas sp.]|nr:serine/threonine protein kinase [Polaromonas sp.]